MAENLFSSSWYRVSHLKPRLRHHVMIRRHLYRGHVSYVLHDQAGDRFHRFGSAAYVVIGLMDGQRTVQEIWDAASARLGDEGPTQHDVIRLISELHAADLLVCDTAPDALELAQRSSRQARRKLLTRVTNIFAWRFPLCDPDRFLTVGLPVVRPFIGLTGAILWMAVVGLGIVLAVVHWQDLTHDVVDRLLAPHNVVLLWLLFPVLKLLHELGHGFITKAFGGDVHELGLMMLVMTPVPYVEASAAWTFSSKWQRILVGAGGMLVELFVASLALVVWLNAEPGLVRMVAYNTILIAGISTVLFNANPLLRFDGYYMLMDFLEIPNLRMRATRFFGYLAERYVCGHREAERPAATEGERTWFVLYGLTSSVYRVLVIFGILFFLGERFPLLAILFAVLTGTMMLGVPLVAGLNFLVTSPRLQRVRVRAVAGAGSLAALLVALLTLVPVPFQAATEGVVWLPDDTFIRAGVDGFIDRVVVPPGAQVQPGQVLVVCRHPELSTQLQVLEGRLRELEARRREQEPTDRVKMAMLDEELRYARHDRDQARARVDRLVIRSRRQGTFVAPTAADLPGRFVRQGDLLAHVVDLHTITVQAVVEQTEIDLVRHGTQRVEVRLSERLGETLPAEVTRIVPAATTRLPSQALGMEGGGEVPTDPEDHEGAKALQPLFQVELIVPSEAMIVNAGGRAHVRFTYAAAPLAAQWSRQLRQLFLTRLHV